jgi:Ca-activated chloride channel homolog
MKKLLIFAFLFSTLSGDILDSYHLIAIKYYETNRDETKLLYHYKKVENKSDEMLYNIGNLYYKNKKYQEAINSYKQITKEAIFFQKYFNIANSYAQLKDFDEALKYYKRARGLRVDEDTKHNLHLIQKELEKRKAKEKSRTKDDEKQNKLSNGSAQEDNSDDENRDNKRESKMTKAALDEKKKQSENERVSANYQRGKQGELPTTKNDTNLTKQQKKVLKETLKKEQLLDVEEKKWLNILSKQEFNTLMIPLNKNGAKNDKTINPW